MLRVEKSPTSAFLVIPIYMSKRHNRLTMDRCSCSILALHLRINFAPHFL